jgi:putative endonuclease
MACVYILYSPSKDRFYNGASTLSASERLDRHLNDYNDGKFTSVADDWTLYLEIFCALMKQALLIEKHIKNMKSKKYIANLRSYPEIIEKLKTRYPDS